MSAAPEEEVAQARGRLAALLKDANEFAALVAILMILVKADESQLDALVSPWVAAFAKSHGLEPTEVWTLLFTMAQLNKTPWAYFVLSPEGFDGDVGRVIKLSPASDKELALLLDKGLERYSFDKKEKEQ